MKEREKTIQIQEMLLELLPHWNDNVVKPFKKSLDEGVNLEMYYCIQRLKWLGGVATMSELAQISRIPNHQMTKLVNHLVQYNFVKRVNDPSDRRIVRIELTKDAYCYIDHFLNENAKCFRDLVEQIDTKDQEMFYQSLQNVFSVLCKLNPQTTPLKERK